MNKFPFININNLEPLTKSRCMWVLKDKLTLDHRTKNRETINPYNMKTAQIKTIEQRLEMMAALGRTYFSEEANQLKKQLADLREIENSKYLKLIQNEK